MNQLDHKNSYFECGVCYQLYNSTNKIPRILMCGHTFCQMCLARIIDKHNQFICPFCKSNLGELRLGCAYKNLSLLKLMELNDIVSKEEPTKIIIKQTYQEIVHEMDQLPKNIRSLVIKRTKDDQKDPFQFDLIRSNPISMRFYKLLATFYKLENFQLWIKFSAHGFEECLSQSLIQLKYLRTVKIVNAYDQYKRLHEIIGQVGNEKITFNIQVRSWDQSQQQKTKL